MKFQILLVSGLLFTFAVQAEFYDPMRPPAFALKKFRLAKIQQQQPVVKKAIKEHKGNPWVLNSILYSSTRQLAIINGQLLKKGESIKGAKLVRLKPDGVRLLSKGKFIDLTIVDKTTKSKFKLYKKPLNENKI